MQACRAQHSENMISKPKLSLALHEAITDEAACCFSKLLLDVLDS